MFFMNWFRNLKVRTKLLSCFVVLAIFTVVVGVVGVFNLKTINSNNKNMYYHNFIPSQNLQTIQKTLEEIRANHLIAVYERNQETFQARYDKINSLVQQSKDDLEKYKETIEDDRDEELYQNVMASLTAYGIIRDENLKLVENQNYDKALEVLKEVTTAREIANNELQALVDYNEELASNTLQRNNENYMRLLILMIAIIILCVFSAIVLGLYISGIISKPVNEMVGAAEKIALGDINVSIVSDTKDEIGKLTAAFNKMIQNIRNQALVVERIADGDLTVEVEIRSDNDLLGKKLLELTQKNNEILTNIASASEQVATGSKQISDSSIALSQGATEQASAIEELTASLEEISSQTQLSAQNANEVNTLAVDAKVNAMKGNDQMKEMLKAMDEINISSSSISRIIKVIDDIAFQTNILALNAAVEAARAGQYGKGFAVVAEEVRNLAARSANAAKETTEMIGQSIKKVEDGTKIANETAQEFQTIVHHIETVAKLVNDIAVASNEQAMGIEQINQGIMQVSEVVQTNTATSEEGAAASEELSNQAMLLKEMVGKFKLRESKYSDNRLEEISPEVLSMLENMVYNKKHGSDTGVDVKSRLPKSKPRIVLSDLEFGKY
jgi:methyl-accepting chemotaxis protein